MNSIYEPFSCVFNKYQTQLTSEVVSEWKRREEKQQQHQNKLQALHIHFFHWTILPHLKFIECVNDAPSVVFYIHYSRW